MRPLARGKARKAVGVHGLAFAVPSCRKQRALPAHRRDRRRNREVEVGFPRLIMLVGVEPTGL